MALGEPLPEAVRTAKEMLERWIAEGFPSLEGRWTLFG
jgi:hydroxymethylpyrimidine/phosphomethylpyrimidine kinase